MMAFLPVPLLVPLFDIHAFSSWFLRLLATLGTGW
ncbi:hypothetical protein P353_04615 [Comamonas testosteroni]|uniref:Uncharacterized protein n=1 Tax=Comamonas testosteroni TaxID=285 RepID=A0A096FPC2_COMTE|nr:hypothetical protein P353_04615 [Comamonas testosteroni]